MSEALEAHLGGVDADADVTPAHHPRNKPCTLCGAARPVLVRCQIDDTGTWHFVCPGKCWRKVSGGVQDAKGHEAEHPHYRYGGMWKNKHAMVSAKKPKKRRPKGRSEDPQIGSSQQSLDGVS